jgi:hypothetical protein
MKRTKITVLLAAVCCLGQYASAAEPTKLACDTYGGYFVSNKFEPDAAKSFVVIHDQEQFSNVFGVAMVMRDKHHRLPKDAFKSLMVIAAIKRGNALVEYKVESVTEAKGVVELKYTTTEKKSDTATFACPLIVSIPKGKYTAVQFVENGKPIKKVEMGKIVANSLDAEPTQETTRSTGVALQGNKESTSKKVAWVVDEATDTQRPKSPLRVRIRMEQPVWGEWESARFDYWIENSDVAVRFRDGDKGRGFAGKLLRLCDSQGKVCSWGDKYVAPKEYPPAFGPVVQGSGHGETVSELRRIAIEDFFGPLKAGQYTLQVIVPSGRLMVNDTPNPQLASGLLTFRVVALTDAMQRAIDSVPQDPAGVILEPQARNAKSGVNHQRVEFKLINGSRVPIEYEGYDDDPTSVVFRWEVFTGDGTWREKDPLGWCGNGMMTKRLGPRESAKIAVSVSETPSRIVRFILEVTDAGTNQVRKIVSPGVELVVEKRP